MNKTRKNSLVPDLTATEPREGRTELPKMAIIAHGHYIEKKTTHGERVLKAVLPSAPRRMTNRQNIAGASKPPCILKTQIIIQM